MLALWRATSEAIGSGLDGGASDAGRAVDAQNATLQRMLYDAGVTREQLSAIAGEVGGDAALRIELWAIAEELLWQLHAAANQVKRRWPAVRALAASARAHGVVRQPSPRSIGAPERGAIAGRRAGLPGRRDNRPAMDFIGSLLDFVFHIDVHLATFVQLLRRLGLRAALRDHLRRDRRRRDAVPARRLAPLRRRRDVRATG